MVKLLGVLIGIVLASGVLMSTGGKSEACCGLWGLGSSGSRYDSSGYVSTD
jgi:hypothetical protein